MNDRFTELLSDYLDHDLPRSEYDAVERHLQECADCRDALAGLSRVKSHAAALVDPPAPADLWAGIASRIGTAGSSSATASERFVVRELPRRAVAWFAPQWLAAAAALVVVTVGALWLAHDRLRPALRSDSLAERAVRTPSVGTDAAAATFDATSIERDISELQQALERGRGKLDPKTVQVLEDNLRIIRKATEDARLALERDPANIDLQDYLAGSVQRKLELVRRAAAMAGV